MFRQVLIAAAAASALSGGAAIAKDTGPSTADASASVSTPAPSAKTRYCLKSEEVTGSMLQRQSCKTLEEWKALGIDPTKHQR